MKLYKLTTQDNKTRKGFVNECLWGPGVLHSGTGKGTLCSEGWIHAYLSPELAVLLNPIHTDIRDPKLWEAEGEISKSDNDLKVGVRTLTTIREIPLPVIETQNRVLFAFLCLRDLKISPDFSRSIAEGIKHVRNREYSAAYRATSAAAYREARAADAAHYAASAAARAADAADAAAGSARAASAAYAAYAAADAARAADAADASGGKLDLVSIARKACHG